jgi:nicotinamide riboside transporter PnuC
MQNWGVIILLLILAMLNYGWVFFPVLGQINSVLNGIILIAILLAAILMRLIKRNEHNK